VSGLTVSVFEVLVIARDCTDSEATQTFIRELGRNIASSPRPHIDACFPHESVGGSPQLYLAAEGGGGGRREGYTVALPGVK
jgi:hypothetical protein